MLYLISLYYKKNIVTGANKRFDEVGKRLQQIIGNGMVKVIVTEGEKPEWCEDDCVIYIKKFAKKIDRLLTNVRLSNCLKELPSGVVISDFLPLPLWGLKNHKHYQLIHDLRSFTDFSRLNIGRLTSYIQRYYLRKSQNVIAVSQFTKNEVSANCGVALDKILVSYNGVNPDEYTKLKGARRDIDLLYVATFEPRKNHMSLLRALRHIEEKLSVVLVGRDLGELNSLIPEINYLNMSGKHRITVIESVGDSELIDIYSRSKVFISPSKFEGFGIPLIEAAVSGCKITCSDIQVFREILGEYPRYFEAGDIESIGFALKQVYEDESAESDFATFVKDKYSWDNITKKLAKDIGLV